MLRRARIYAMAALLLLPVAAQETTAEVELESLQQQAQAGDPHATQQLYLRYAISGDTEQARKWAARYNEQLEKLAQQGNSRAQLQLGSRYLAGADYTEQNLEKAVKLFSQASEAGEPSAAYILGEIFAKQGNVPESTRAYERAYELYTRRDTAEALYWQGFMELYGIGTKRQAESGIAKLTRAADMGSAWAASQLFKTYYNGIGTPRDVSLALRFARKLADEHKDGTMAYVVATAYLKGDEVEQDEKLGEQYLDQAAASNNPDAIYVKANRLENSGKLAEALPLYRQAASMQQRDALVRMGKALLLGTDGVEKDESRGLAMVEMAASRYDSPSAAWELACYYDAIGERDLADSWYATAAHRGVAQAMARRGVLHIIPGSEVTWSPTEAYRWWRTGKAAGDSTCRLYLNLFHYGFIPLLLLLVFGTPAYIAHRARRKLEQE